MLLLVLIVLVFPRRPRLALSAKHQPSSSLVSHSSQDEAAEACQGLTFFRPPHFALYLSHTLHFNEAFNRLAW